MHNTNRKVVIVGTGFVGSSAAYSIVNRGVCDELVLIDINEKRAQGEALDLSHCADFLPHRIKIKAGGYEECRDAHLIIITAGAAQKPGQTRLDLMDLNVSIMKGIVSGIMGSGFNGLILVASNPADIMTYAVWKLSGLPKHRVIGTGTSLDSSRLKAILSDIFKVDARSINGFTLGEHGDSQFIPWSRVTIGTKPILELIHEYPDKLGSVNLDDIEQKVRRAAYDIIERKGSTYYGIGTAISNITQSIFSDDHSVRVLSTLLHGEYGVYGTYTSVPVILTNEGVKGILELDFTEKEWEKFHCSYQTLHDGVESLNL
ncbi:L-lactate dehydrogenase [Priestia filamentosa]|uniref:L-lactate dehydrogenase n=1 Tax=Priestia filamentosa TaxID=1402861 RepID=UPI00398228E7